MAVLKKADRFLGLILRYICAFLLGLMVIVVFGQVIARYIFSSGFNWPEELTRFSCIWITFLGAAMAVSTDSHPAVDILVKALPGTIQTLVRILLRMVMITVCGYLAYYGEILVEMTIHDMSPGLHFSMGLVYLSLPISAVIMIIYLCAQLIQAVGSLVRCKEDD